MKKSDRVVLSVALVLGAILCFQMRASRADDCLQCDADFSVCRNNCNTSYDDCIWYGGSAVDCEGYRNDCMAPCNSNYTHCVTNCPTYPPYPGNPPPGNHNCLTFCRQQYQNCLALPADYGCPLGGETVGQCCSEQRTACETNCQ